MTPDDPVQDAEPIAADLTASASEPVGRTGGAHPPTGASPVAGGLADRLKRVCRASDRTQKNALKDLCYEAAETITRLEGELAELKAQMAAGDFVSPSLWEDIR
jgi:hypothetical protein